jgi:hypothetical protein
VLSFAVYLFIPEAYSKSASGWPHFVDRLILRQVNKKNVTCRAVPQRPRNAANALSQPKKTDAKQET